jgi:hypothetical protein
MLQATIKSVKFSRAETITAPSGGKGDEPAPTVKQINRMYPRFVIEE